MSRGTSNQNTPNGAAIAPPRGPPCARRILARALAPAGLVAAPESLDGPRRCASRTSRRRRARAPTPYGSWRAASSFVRVGVPARDSASRCWSSPPRISAAEARVGAIALAAAGSRRVDARPNAFAGGLTRRRARWSSATRRRRWALDMPVGPVPRGPRDIAFDFWQRVKPDFAVCSTRRACAISRDLLADKKTTAGDIGIRAAAIVTDLRDPATSLPDLGVPTTRIVGFPRRSPAGRLRRARHLRRPGSEVVLEVRDGELLITTLRHSAALVRYAPGVKARHRRARRSAAARTARSSSFDTTSDGP